MGRTTKATLVIASAMAETRRRWSRRLQETFAICEVAEGKALEQVTANLRPDVVVVDLTLPRLGRLRGLPHIQRWSRPTKTLVLTDAPTEGEAIAVLRAGARGYYSRTIDAAQLMKAVAVVQKGEIWLQRKLIPRLVAEITSLAERRQNAKADPLLEGLTARQRLTAELLSRGASNREIAAQLNISERTVKAHLTETFRYLGVSDRVQLALLLKRPRN